MRQILLTRHYTQGERALRAAVWRMALHGCRVVIAPYSPECMVATVYGRGWGRS